MKRSISLKKIIFLLLLALIIACGDGDSGGNSGGVGETYTISRVAGGSQIIITASDVFGGAIKSLAWKGKEFLNSSDRGRNLQSASSFDRKGEGYNPTEAGSSADGTGPTSMSVLLEVSTSENILKTKTQMAYWLPVNGVALSNHILSKTIMIGHPASDYVIQYDVSFQVPESHGYGLFEALTAYMPPEFSDFWTFNPATGELGAIGPGAYGFPVVFSSGTGYAMGVYSPDHPNARPVGIDYGVFDAELLQNPVVKWNCVFRYQDTPAGDYNFKLFVIVGSLNAVRISMIQLHDYFNPPPPKIEIKKFVRLPECDLPLSAYFAAYKINGEMHFSTYGYQNGIHAAKIYKYPKQLVLSTKGESVYAFMYFKGKYYFSTEGDRGIGLNGQIYRLDGSKWTLVYTHPTWDLLFNMHVHGGYLYVSGCRFSGGDAGVIRSSDGVNWNHYLRTDGRHVFFGMATLGSELWIHAEVHEDGDSHVALFKNQGLFWEDHDWHHTSAGGIAAFKGDIFFGTDGQARVIRASDKAVVLYLPDKMSAELVVDTVTDTLLALISNWTEDTGSQVFASKNGVTWKEIPGTGATGAIGGRGAYLDPATGELWLPSGKVSQGPDGFGRIYRSVR